ncbi:unnamed protein product [Lactuca saligna]|uniref:Cobalamin-independent methionine synthase MetE N-terminal domain-containing protein n=1 Tax=Lactuca saligna TaxID=75948 RepID=A0AA35UNX7_LACSI|nr:unnamed protein product [Lactuca saligna]
MFNAQHGSFFLSSLLMQLWNPMWNEISISKMEGRSNELIIRGPLEAIDFAIKSLKYIGEGNFSGEDTVRVTTMNKHGKHDLHISVIVNPRNDPPFISGEDTVREGNFSGEDSNYPSREVIVELKESGTTWIHVDEATLVKDLEGYQLEAFTKAYFELKLAFSGLNVIVATYFADIPTEAFKTPTSLPGVVGFSFDLIRGEKTLNLI